MAAPRINIVQAEFFHVGGEDTSSLEALFLECRERTLEGLELALEGHETRSKIKTVVRFFDESGALTRIARKAERLEKLERRLFDECRNATGWRRRFLNYRIRRLAGKKRALGYKVRVLASEYLRQTVRAGLQIAVERSDHTFRFARKDEGHELAEAAQNARSAWLFVFRPNDLLSDKNEIVACAM